MTVETKTWEERVMSLEASLEQSATKVEALAAELAAKDATVTALQASVAAHEEAESARRKASADAYLAELKAGGIEAQSPIPETDLATVATALERGDETTARLLGDAFLTRSKALGSASVGGGPRVVTLGAHVEDEDAKHKAEMAEFRRRHPNLKGA